MFIGWGGSTLLVVGGLIYSAFAGKEGFESRYSTAAIVFQRLFNLPTSRNNNHAFVGLNPTVQSQKDSLHTRYLSPTQLSQRNRRSYLQLAQRVARAGNRGAAVGAEPAVFLRSPRAAKHPRQMLTCDHCTKVENNYFLCFHA